MNKKFISEKDKTWEDRYDEWFHSRNLSHDLIKELHIMNKDEKIEAFHKNLEFGTGGMRGLLGVGSNRMNVHTVRRATYGLGAYLLEKVGDVVKNKGVIIAHDNRHYSKQFALEAALTLGSKGIRTYLFKDLRPTPELSFAVRYLGCSAGIMITASHNPKEYNGYKVYDETGCQYTPDKVKDYVDYIDKILRPMDIKPADTDQLIEHINDYVDLAYIQKLKLLRMQTSVSKLFKVAYTPLHGTGAKIIPNVLNELGYEVFEVESQMKPDPNFTNVKSSNPEDKVAFEEVVTLGKKVGASIVFATDPDADRLGCAILHQGEYHFVNGNQMATLLTHYILKSLKEFNKLPQNGAVYSTIVSSELPLRIARSYGVKTETYLTGFKYIGEAIEKNKNDYEFLFGYEESYGCLIKDYVRDKDSVQAIILMCEMVGYYLRYSKTLIDVLEDIYKEYGYFIETQYSVTMEGISGVAKIKSIMEDFRENMPTTIGKVKVIGYVDYLKSKEDMNGEVKIIDLPKSNVIKVFLEDESWFALRPSGTEPKFKVYAGVVTDNLDLSMHKLDSLLRNALSIVGVNVSSKKEKASVVMKEIEKIEDDIAALKRVSNIVTEKEVQSILKEYITELKSELKKKL